MNNALLDIKRNYKPYRVTKKKGVTIVDSTSGSFVIKNKKDDRVKEAYRYLMSRSFDYFPPMVEEDRSDANVFAYLEDTPMPIEQKALDMIEIVSLLHNKTTYYKEITENNLKEIYDNLKGNILYAKNYYDEIYNILVEKIFHSPSDYLLLRNLYKIFAAIDFCLEELDSWYDKVKDNKKERVVLNHNNLEMDHFIRNTKGYLVSWDYARIDSPVLDLIHFYQKEYMNLDFESLFQKYFKSYPFNDEEKQLLFITLSVPPIIKLEGSEFQKVRYLRKQLDYIFKTEMLVQKFYFNNEDK